MYTWPLDRQGFITHYMVCGPKVDPFFSEMRDKNQLRYEAFLRSLIARHIPVPHSGHVCIREDGRLGMPWRFYGGQDCAFVNLSEFYPVMQRVQFDACTVLTVPQDMEIRAMVWSYAAVDVYCNDHLIGGISAPVYKPIEHSEVTLPLRKGSNVIYLACEALGVRDTRSIVGLQISTLHEKIRVTLPDEVLSQVVGDALSFVESAELKPEALCFSRPAPAGTVWAWTDGDPDYAHAKWPLLWQRADGLERVPLVDGRREIILRLPVGDFDVQRRFERTEQIRPQFVRPVPSVAQNERLIYKRIAAVESLSRGGKFGFPIANMLARKFLGDTSKDDARLMDEALTLIEKRVDCADFLLCGLIRYVKHYEITEETAARVRKVLTHFRYWMDQDGFDGMCFWSENHSLMFYACAMQAGEMYPDDHFQAARMTGRELHKWGKGKVLDWLEDVETHGFEEFQSTVYACVTFAALINVVDFSEKAISERAARITDRLLRMMALHTFKGGIIAPQGRVYRGVLYPFQAGAMALMNLADPAQPYDYGEGWLGFYATSGYRFPEDLHDLMVKPVSVSYTTGNARIVLEKHKDWCLTSVQSPREPFDRWQNIAGRQDADPSTHEFVKSYNERFHGTTCFQPGVYGYQQHLWYAALDGEAALFVNHPGSASEGGDLRPGYWHGNGVFPAIKQEGAILGAIYCIPPEHPLHYIHLYCPECRFDEVHTVGNWLLLQKGSGYIGFWSSVPMEPWNGMNFNCEKRMWGDEIACLVLCAGEETQSMETFEQRACALAPDYHVAKKQLTAGNFSLTWLKGNDDTQKL